MSNLVQQLLDPISPERIAIMTEKGGDGSLVRNRNQEQRLQQRLAHLDLPFGKLDMIFRLIEVMTSYYRAPHLFTAWATGLANREALASTGIGRGFGLLHQFQDDGYVTLTNPPVDWWLFLCPEGIDWQALDGEPVFGMIGHIFPPHHHQLPGLKLPVYELASRVALEVTRTGQGFDQTAWKKIARLDRIEAARKLNCTIGRCIAE